MTPSGLHGQGADGREFLLRRAVEADVGHIVDMLAADQVGSGADSAAPADRAPYLAAFRAIDADPAQLLCVVESPGSADGLDVGLAGTVVGTMQLTFIPGMARSGALRLQLEAVHVSDTLRSRGLGAAMVEWALAEGRRRGARLAQLTSNNARTDAHRFYERLGFVKSHAGFKKEL